MTADQGLAGNWFQAEVALRPAAVNFLFLTETTPAGTTLAPVTVDVLQDGTPPELFVDTPVADAQLTEPTVVVSGRVSDNLSGLQGLSVTVNGLPANVDNGIGTSGTYELELPLDPIGETTSILVEATDALGNTIAESLDVERVALVGPRMTIVGGNMQSAVMQTDLPLPIEVLVERSDATPFANKLVTFHVGRSDGRLRADPSSTTESMTYQTFTDASGLARATWRLGSDAGCANNRVEVTSRGLSGVVGFVASALPGAPASLNVTTGDAQVGPTGGLLPVPLEVWVNDGCNGVPGVPVSFVVREGGGYMTADGAGPTTALTIPTDEDGHATVRAVLGLEPGLNVIEARFLGGQDGHVFQARGVAASDGLGTFSGVVLDNLEQPLGGAVCTLRDELGNSRTSVSGTDGGFRFEELDFGGQVHLDVEGATVVSVNGQPNSKSYPHLAFLFGLVEGAEQTMPRPVLLPPMETVNERIYDGVNDVVLTIDGIEGFEMFVEAGSMRLADGSPAPAGTVIAANVVQIEDIPMVMPNEARPPFAWTLQPAGATFDPPVRMRYPNLAGLPPGALSYFLSYNHATETFEIVATGSVLDDGSCVETDPGSGLSIAGWGGICPPYDPPPPQPPGSQVVNGEAENDGDGDQNGPCDAASGNRVFGPISVGLPGSIDPVGDVDDQGFCGFAASGANASLEFLGIFQQVVQLQGLDVEWSEAPGDPTNYDDVRLTWTGDLDAGSFGPLSARVISVNVTVDGQGRLGGGATFEVMNDQPVPLGGIAFLAPGIIGTFSFQFGGQTSFDGSFDFGGLENINVELIKGTDTIAQLENGSVSADGVLSGTLIPSGSPTFMTNSFTVTLSQLSAGLTYDLESGDLSFDSGTGKIDVTDVQFVQGMFSLDLAFANNMITATLGAENLELFGMTVDSVSGSATITTQFELTSVDGTLSGLQSTQYEGIQFPAVNLSLLQGVIDQLSFPGPVPAITFSGFDFQPSNVTYMLEGGVASLMLDAQLSVENVGGLGVSFAVSDFKIATDGTVTLGGVSGSISQEPVMGMFSANFNETSFDGMFGVTFASSFGLAGTVQIGNAAGGEGEYTYAHFTVMFSGAIPIGMTGLLINPIAGEFGYNWTMPAEGSVSDPCNPPPGMPAEGQHLIGLGFGIQDVGGLAQFKAYTRLAFGEANPSVAGSGQINIPASDPWVSGTLNVDQYVLGSDTVNGSFVSTIKVPADGSVLDISAATLNYTAGPFLYSVQSPGPQQGTLFGIINLQGDADFSGDIADPLDSLSGSVVGSASYMSMHSVTWPAGFNPSDCTTTEAGFGIQGDLNVGIAGMLNATIDENGIVGGANLTITLGGTATVATPDLLGGCEIDVVSVSSFADGTVTLLPDGRLELTGSFEIAVDGEGVMFDDVTIIL